tara:strand:+ start:5590 stop:7518 length:1929 start_codon:yes stop_codon:yes gene_type:complete
MSVSRDETYLRTLKETHAELQHVKSSGNWLIVISVIAVVLLYSGAGLAALAYLGQDAFLALDPIWFVAAGTLLAGPALAILLAGFLARQSQRTSRANALILRASQLLLMPAELAGNRVDNLAVRVREETVRIDEAVETAHASLANLKNTLTSEREEMDKFIDRNRDQIGVMVQKLADERQALAELTSAVEAQTESISEAIPRQARTMADAARMAQQEIAKADLAVDERLKALDDSGRRLGEQLAALGDMSLDAEARTDQIAKTVAGVIEQLNASAKTVDTAIRASEMASSAATETGDALNAAVSSALDGTREASEFIRLQSRDAVAEALKAMADLKAAGEAAEAATRSAGDEARAEADRTEQRIQELSHKLYEAATKATSAAEAGLERARTRIERASGLLNGLFDADIQSDPPPPPAAPPPPQLRPRQSDDLPPAPSEDEIFTPAAPEPDARQQPPGEPEPPQIISHAPPEPEASNSTETAPDGKTETEAEDGSNTLFDVAFDRASLKERGVSWRDLLSGIEPEPEERNEAARNVLAEISDAGVELNGMLSMKETRKIAGAARKGDRQRHRAVREYAGSAVQTLTYRLEDDAPFRQSVEQFLSAESQDAASALTEAEKSRTEASSRLTAYLILDTAMKSIDA